MNVKLVVLGLLMEKNRHPYEIQQILQQSHMKYYMKITKGSLYYNFEKLEEQGFIAVTDIISDTPRPEKTVYGVTENGVKEFNQLLLEQIGKQENMQRAIHEALLFAQYGDIEPMIAKLEEKVAETKLYLTTMETVYEKKYRQENLAIGYILTSVILHLRTELLVLTNLCHDMKTKKLTEKGIDVLRIIDPSQ
ncbi:PadR family transcriptional regulator [Ectobacillus antri]|jgi:DNA-binding PadR family transcriptional regulator|uniref:PadR family transcriptional regulator n=1 Tax=Ectobacillus antri TaxID=2486280 RepID=A0ABT6H2F8_9BACI|nr:PadR family transcriptional regulator [Ectobacillus antri]MDG4656447.1 PadR family transcriptional regulator [Ectobacillus antri]MDG5753497.1 PadR family transcriptional regulator [Ectobacillus antri]